MRWLAMASISYNDAMRLFADTVGKVVGPRSEAYRDLTRAAGSSQPVDLLLAHSSFDALPGEIRRKIGEQVSALVRQHAG